MRTLLLLACIAGLSTFHAPEARATVCFGPISLIGGAPAAVPSIITAIGAGTADYNVGWQGAAYTAGALTIIGGAAILGIGAATIDGPCNFSTVDMTFGALVMAVGAVSIGMGVLNSNKARPDPDGLELSYAPLLDARTGTAGLMLGGRF